MDVPEGCYTYLAEGIKNNVSIPIFSSNRINTPELAEQILMAGKADAICMGRALIADPYLPMKAKKGEIQDIMNCVACNQGCFDNVFKMMPVSCLRNARAGNEARMALKPIKEKKKVMIIGAGPAGLEAARIARMRGHEVHLFEKDAKIGGLLNIICIPPGRSEFKKMIENYTYWIHKLGIDLHLQTEVTVDIVKEFRPDVVFVATGSIPTKVPIPGIDRKNVYWANDVFSRDAPIGNNNVIIGGGATGIELAIYLAKYGSLSRKAFEFLTLYKALEPEIALKMLYKGNKKVTVLEQLPKLGSNLGRTTKWVLLDKCDFLGVKFLTSVKVTEIGEDFVSYTDNKGTEQRINDVDMVYYATGVASNDNIAKEIKKVYYATETASNDNIANEIEESEKVEVIRIGDAQKPQTVLEAVERAYKTANKI